MATAKSSFIIKRYEPFGGGFIDSQYLGNSYETGKPHVFEGTLMKIYSSKTDYFQNKPLLASFGMASGGIQEIDNEIFRYKLQGAEYRCARVVENLEAGNAAPGLNGETFSVKLDQDYYTRPEVMMPEDPDFPAMIVEGPIEDGTGYIYRMKLQGDNPGAFLPANLLEVGAEWSKSWTAVASEYNEEFGNQQYAAMFELEQQIGAFAQKLLVTDKAWREQGRLGITFLDGKGSAVKKFLPYAEHKMHEQLHMSMEAAMWYGKRMTTEGPQKYWIKTGSGVREILKDGFTEYYNGPLTATRLKDYLLDIFFARESVGNRKVAPMTGTLGSLMFHDLLATEAASFLTVDSHFTKPYAGGPGSNDLQFGGQYRKYVGPEGIEVTLVINPMYDNPMYCKRRHPTYTEIPIDSTRFTFLDFGKSDGENNIQMLKVKDTYRWGYVAGTHTPMGPRKGGEMSSTKAGYTMTTEGTGGIWIKDPTRGKVTAAA